ncbi:MAG: DNA mismatch repair protein MutS, partial [Pseudomonadota bacterium]
MMAQYLEIKAEHANSLLFYRMGDFYEMFFDDAVAAAEALDIALTKRGKHDGQDIPMCGVPVHSAEGYLLTLIRKGFRVAVGEQLESPAEAKKRGSKSVVKRGVVRLVTPGTLTEDSLLEARSHNFLAAYSEIRGDAAIAWTDISTGAFHVMPINPNRLSPELARLAPAELVVADGNDGEIAQLASEMGVSLTPMARSIFDSAAAEKRICATYNIGGLDGFGHFGRAEISAMGALIDYLNITQKGKRPLLQKPVREATDRVMQIDAATRRNLELTRALAGGRAGSLLSVIDRTVTPGGARLLEQRLSSPSRDLDLVQARLDAVAFAIDRDQLAEDIRAALRKTPDLDRALSRLSLDRGGPRDIAAIRNALTQAEKIASLAKEIEMPQCLAESLSNLIGFEGLLELLDAALIAEPPLLARDGGFIAAGYDPELDEARTLRDEGRSVIAGMQQDYITQTGIASLKIKHNNVLGYFIETTATHAEKMLGAPLSETFIHRQTTANQVRFTTVELSEIETRILNAGGLALDIEKRLYARLSDAVLADAARLNQAARGLAELDHNIAVANLARAENWCRPRVDHSRAYHIQGGRHPVVENALRATGDSFIANNCDLPADDGSAIWLLTGPNMAGKSTFLRQNALIAILGQMGSFVP